jgi:GDP-4-dehydro-6-deoxy-D-mannose reductase
VGSAHEAVFVRAAVTGARGFVGRHLTAHLTRAGDDVLALDVDSETPVDITDGDALGQLLRAIRPDAVYHLAARSHVGESWDDVAGVRRVNVDGTVNVLRACREAGVGRVLVVGSAEEYGPVTTATPITEDTPLRPASPYARSKADAEALALTAHRDHGLGVVCVRAFNHIGPGQSVKFLVPGLASRIVAVERSGGDEVAIGNLDPVRDYTDVRDVVRAYRLLVLHGEAGGVYNVCSGTGVSVAEIAAALLAQAERRLRLVVDADLVRATDVPMLVGDPAALVRATGWSPSVPLAQTVEDVMTDARSR